MPEYKYLSIREEEDEAVEKVAVALSSKIRRDILRLVDEQSYNISEIASKLELPISTVAFHVRHLREADMIQVRERMMTRGVEKLVSRKVDEITLRCKVVQECIDSAFTTLQIPIGSYTEFRAKPTCGMATADGMIGVDDTPGIFYSAERSEAQIVWLAEGYLEYRIPNYYMANEKATELLFSMEICSEAPNYRNNWCSDITFWINGHELCTWTSPGDFGGRRGRMNPKWWPDISTQYGLLKSIRVNERGVYLDEQKVASTTISQLHIEENDYFTLRVGVKEDANYIGGLNIFGKKFGDYEQDINVRIEHKTKREDEKNE